MCLAEVAASVPQTEIVGKGDYFRFGMRDSLAIEASFLQVMKISVFIFLLCSIDRLTSVNEELHYVKRGSEIYLLYLQREDELLSSWWKEYAECSEGPRGQPSIKSKSSQQLSSASPESCQLFTTEEERVGVPVKGGLYEVVFSFVVVLYMHSSFVTYWVNSHL